MRRRHFIGLIGGAAAWPLAARAQQHPPMGVPSSGTRQPVLGFLYATLAAEYGLRLGLSDLGYVEGENIAIDYRSATVQVDRLPAMAEELARRHVAVIISVGDDHATRAAMAATKTIPIVFTTAGSPVQLGFVASLNRPGGNVTGITTFGQELLPKRLELLREIMPKSGKVALLVNPNGLASSQLEIQSTQAAASRIGLDVVVVNARSEDEIESALTTAVRERAAAVLVASDVFLSTRHEYIGRVALRHALPAMSHDRVAVVGGQLLSYGSDPDEVHRLAGRYVGRLLKGEKPAELPVIQPTRFELVINLKTAKTLGLEVPPTLLARADAVIE
jgi:putative ABC transport system substrate-binding protein